MYQEIDHEPVFNWWVNVVLKKRLLIISPVKKRNDGYLKKKHKFRIEVPKSVNSHMLWMRIIATPFGQMSLLNR